MLVSGLHDISSNLLQDCRRYFLQSCFQVLQPSCVDHYLLCINKMTVKICKSTCAAQSVSNELQMTQSKFQRKYCKQLQTFHNDIRKKELRIMSGYQDHLQVFDDESDNEECHTLQSCVGINHKYLELWVYPHTPNKFAYRAYKFLKAVTIYCASNL